MALPKLDWQQIAAKQMEDIKELKAKLAKRNSIDRDIYEYRKDTVDKIIRESNRRLVNFDSLSAIIKEMIHAMDIHDKEMVNHYKTRIKVEHSYVINPRPKD